MQKAQCRQPEDKGDRSDGQPLTYLFNEAHEAGPEAPGFVSITLQGADCHLGKLLDAHRHHVHRVIHQSSIGLKAKKKGNVESITQEKPMVLVWN